ncbi:hypothetical protein GJ744_007780 [Endocarpon pusillum]|uniref:RRM domain-containing protein n=1 Tax=Endocarpon pusillum TaxID=364733 RepID=A0A8H7E7X5_9EURO|nr:hypothetical protein GJ744_007780 [Endocarpon pusillum]
MATQAVPSRNGVAGKDAVNAGTPNQTLYCTNLPEKIGKPELRRALYMLFSTYGPVLDVNATRAKGMRGQAHIVFRDIQTSTQAMRALQRFDFFGKEMKIVYGKGQSQIIPKLRGTFEMPSVATEATTTTDLQKSIFNAPPGSVPSKPVEIPQNKTSESEAPHGTKRPRDEEEEDEQGEASMEEDEDSDAPMEASSDED